MATRASPTRSDKSAARSRTERRLAAVIGLDIKDYSALMAEAEEDTHDRVNGAIDRVRREIAKSYGSVFSFAGDGLMAEFPSAVEALKCALRIQSDMARREARHPADRRIQFRVGLNAGEIISQHGQAGGNTINIAARLEQIAEPGGICLSAAAFEQVKRVVITRFEPSGERNLKNIREPVAIYRVPPEACLQWAGMPALPRSATSEAGRATIVDYRATLAVLPFRTLQRDQSDAWFAEGMVEDIIRALGGLKDLIVVSRSSSQLYAGAALDLRRIGHELDVQYVVHGSVRRAGDALRITVELSEVATGQVIWTDRLDGKLDDLFDLQDRIAIRVATVTSPHLRERELARASRKRPENMTAYDLTLQALDRLHRLDRGAMAEARDLLQRALASDPGYAPAYSQLALLHFVLIGQGWTDDEPEACRAASSAARAAIEHDRNDALGLAIFGHLQSYVMRDFHSGNEFLERAVTAGPSCAWAWGYSSITRGYLGHYAAAVTRAEQAVRLSPIGTDSFWFDHFLSQAYYLSERFEEAVDWARLSASRVERNLSNLRCLAASLAAVGDVAGAQLVARRIVEFAPHFNLRAFRGATLFGGAVRDRFIERLRIAGVSE